MKTFEITVRGDTLQELASNLLHIAKQYQVTTPGQDARPAAEGKANAEPATPPAVKKDAKPSAKTPAAKTPAKQAEPADDDDDNGAPAFDYKNDVAPKVLALAEKHGRDAAETVLLKFGVKRAPHLSPDQYPAVMKALDEALAD